MSRRFQDVEVSIPSSTQRASESADEGWQDVSWVQLALGDVLVDERFGLKIAYGSGKQQTTPLGTLLQAVRGGTGKAEDAEDEEATPTLTVTTSDKVQSLLRLSFQTARDYREFEQLAQEAEAAKKQRDGAQKAAAKARTSASAEEAVKEQARLEAAVANALATQRKGAPPALLFGGAELFGPAPFAEDGPEVRMGAGFVALCDPGDCEGRVGTWEFVFFDADDVSQSEPFKKVIGPRLRFSSEAAEDGAKTVQLQFDASLPRSSFSLCFESEAVADRFLRDLRVRQMVMQLSHKVNRTRQATSDLREELTALKQGHCMSILWGCLVVFLIAFLAVMAQAWRLHKDDNGRRPWGNYIMEAIPVELVWRAVGAARAMGSTACGAVFGTVPPDDLQRCLGAGESRASLARCVEAMLPPSAR